MKKQKKHKKVNLETFLNTSPSEKVEIVETKEERPTFGHEELIQALYFAFDLFSRPNIPLLVLGDTARQIKDNSFLSGPEVTVGMREVDFQQRNLAMMDTFFPADVVDKDNICYTYIGVPVKVYIIRDRSDMFTNPDKVMYQHEFFCLPNPFEVYWSKRLLYHG